MATSIVQSGNYALEIDTGFIIDGFTLDSATAGILDGTEYVLDGTTSYADVTGGALNISIKRGRQDIGDQFSAGTMSFTLNDTAAGGVFNPFDSTSPYFDQFANVPGLAPLRRVRLYRYNASNVAEPLFVGRVVNYDYQFVLGGSDTVTVYCADDFYLLAQTNMDELNVTPETSGERIETVLDLPEVDYPSGAAYRDIDPGTVDLGHSSEYTVPAGTNVLSYLAQINDTSEFGRLFMARDGKLVFQPRIGTTLSAPVVDFMDDGTGVPFDNVGISFEADAVVNRAVVTGLNGTSSTDSDAGSISTYFIQNESITNSLLHTAGQIADAAAYLLVPEPEARYTDVSVSFASLTTAQRDTVAIADIGSTISIEKSFQTATGPSQLDQELSIEGIEHRIDYATGHRITFYTSPTTIVYELMLDDATYGVLDAENVLG